MAEKYFNLEKDPLMGDEDESETGVNRPAPDPADETVVSPLSGHMGSKVYRSTKVNEKKKPTKKKAAVEEDDFEELGPAKKLELAEAEDSAEERRTGTSAKKPPELSGGFFRNGKFQAPCVSRQLSGCSCISSASRCRLTGLNPFASTPTS